LKNSQKKKTSYENLHSYMTEGSKTIKFIEDPKKSIDQQLDA